MGSFEFFSSIGDTVTFFETYGLWFLFIIVYLEYLNMPGLPAGIIMPAIGAMVAHSKYNFLFTLLVSIIAGVLGSICLYYVGYFVGNPILKWIYNKFPSSRKGIDKVSSYNERFGEKAVFICRLVPVARTLISLTSGTLRDNIINFTLYSIPGIAIWNSVTIMCGYLATRVIVG